MHQMDQAVDTGTPYGLDLALWSTAAAQHLGQT